MTETRWPKWQTIDRAPKDGRDVLLCREGDRTRTIGFWCNCKSGPQGKGHWAIEGLSFIDWGPPTHFAPLPDAIGAPKVGEVA